MSSKKGEVLGYPIIQMFWVILALVVVMGVLLWYVNGLGDQTKFQKNFLSTDLALIMDTLYSMPQPGNLFIIYLPKRIKEEIEIPFGYVLSKNKIEVKEKSDSYTAIAHFTPRPGITVEKSTLSYEESLVVPIIIKQDDKISAYDINKKDFDYSRSILACTGPEIKKKYVPLGTEEISRKIADAVSKDRDVSTTDSSAPKLMIAQTDEQAVKVYFNGNTNPDSIVESRRAGCEIVNKLIKLLYENDIVVKESGVIPINPSQKGIDLRAGDLFLVIGKESKFENTEFQRKIVSSIKEGLVHARS